MFGKIKKPNLWLIGAIAVGVLGIATTAYLALRGTASKSDITKLIVEVTSKDIAVEIKANGVVQAVQNIKLSPKEAGRIAKLYVEEGDRVEPGQLVARMEDEQFKAQVNQYKALLAKAEADLAQKRAGTRPEEISSSKARVTSAEANVAESQAKLERAREVLKRNQFLVQEGAISQNALGDYVSQERSAKANLEATLARVKEQKENLEKLRNGTRKEEIAQAEADVAQAKAQLQYYETQLKNTLIRAPFAGTVTRRFAQEGDFVTPTTAASTSDGATSTSIVELSKGLEVEAKVPEASIARIKPGQSVEIRADAYLDDIFKGSVRLIAPRAVQENNVTSFRVKIALQTGQDKLKSAMNVKLTFQGEPIPNALVVPLAAVVTKKDSQTGVLVLDKNNQTQFRPVSVGSTSGDQIQILQGLSKGERILLSPPPGEVIPGVDTQGF